MLATAPKAMSQAQGQVPVMQERPALPQGQVSIDAGMAPDCPYGYYEAAPNACAPYGYYGPEWFTGGVFVGAGQWFHGSNDFHGQVDSRLSVDNGYKGKLPERGEKAEPANSLEKNNNFKGNETRDGRGHVSAGQKDGGKH